jgi:F-type H+-transporting ATPase subunit b
MEDLITALKINFKVLFTQFVGFMILFLLLKKFLFGRVMDLIQTRTDEIRGAFDANEKTREEVASLKLQYEQRLQEARKEVIEKTRRETAQIRDRGIAEIEQEKKRVITEIRRDVVSLSMEIARKIIDKAVDQKEAEKLTDEVINKIGGVTL